MCGIFASTRPDLWADHIQEILHLLDHRGPDAHGVWRDELDRALLVHTRLAVIGLGEAGRQPSTTSCGSLAVTFNGEIYNYRELARSRRIADAASDTKVLAELLQREGASCLVDLRGMYAFAAWDVTTRTLTVARDPWGIKPLYLLRHDSGGVTVCSELPPLLLIAESRRLDPLGVAGYLGIGHTGPSGTLFRDISKIPPGTCWQWGEEEGHPTERSTRIGTLDGRWDHGRTVAEAVEDSVDAHMVADVEVGVFLSGGIDSTLLAASARRRHPDLRTFTLAFPDEPAIDESTLASANAGVLGTRHRTIPVRPGDMMASAQQLVAIHGEPLGDAAVLPLGVLAASASEDVKVVLAGEGADELFGGYKRYEISALLGRLPARRLRALAEPLASAWAARRGDSGPSRAVEAVLRGGGVTSHLSLLGADVMAMATGGSVEGEAVLHQAMTDWCSVARRSERETAREFDLARWLPNVYLEKTDKATMASGLEARVPYLDPVVFHAAEASRGRAFGKGSLRAELEALLPGVQLPAGKRGLAVRLDPLREAGLGRHIDYELNAAGSTLARFAGSSRRTLRTRCEHSSTTAFRVGMLGLWDATFDGSTFS